MESLQYLNRPLGSWEKLSHKFGCATTLERSIGKIFEKGIRHFRRRFQPVKVEEPSIMRL